MKRLIMLLVTTLLAATGMAVDNSGADGVHWTGTGDWMNAANWVDDAPTPDWDIPGWVFGNPENAGGSTNPDWNLGIARIDGGTVNITPTSKPDGTVATLYVGSNIGAATINIGNDFTVKGNTYMGYEATDTDVATINQTAGNVLLGNSASSRAYLGVGAGQTVYNLSGGTLATPGDWTRLGNGSTFTFNQTGGTYTDSGAGGLMVAETAGTTATINLDGGTFNANSNETRVGSWGNGILNVAGGTFNSSSLHMFTGWTSGALGTINISDGEFNYTHVDGILYVGRYGQGIINQTGGDVTIANHVWLGRYESTATTNRTGLYSISGGSLTVGDQFRGYQSDNKSGLEVVGSGATSISLNSLNFYKDLFRVKLDGDGATLVNVGAGGVDLRYALFEVDTLIDFDGLFGDVYDIMWTGAGFQTDGMIFSVLSGAADFEWDIVAKDGGEVLQLTVIPEPATMILLTLGGGGLLLRRKRT